MSNIFVKLQVADRDRRSSRPVRPARRRLVAVDGREMTPTNLLNTALPLAAAPMAGGGTTTALARAAVEAGAFAFLAAGYKTPEAVEAEIAALRPAGDAFGVNLFAPDIVRIEEADFRRYAREVQPDADRYGIDLSQVALREDDDRWADKLDLLLAEPVPVVSVTFGLPRPAELRALRRAGTRVFGTVTTVAEAAAAADAGCDGLVVQGSGAGGHSGTFDPHRTITPMPTADLVRAVLAATGLPAPGGGRRRRPRIGCRTARGRRRRCRRRHAAAAH